MEYKVVIVDDHKLVSSAIRELLQAMPDIDVLYEVENGQELLNKLHYKNNVPDLILLDLNMPVMDGYQTMEKLHSNYPEIKVLGLSMNDDESSYLKLIKLGANGFLSKVADENELYNAIITVIKTGYYYTENIINSLFRSVNNNNNSTPDLLSTREIELLSYIGSELTYVEIADQMNLSPKTIDGYRNSLFEKLDVKSRTGLVVFAIKNGYYQI